MLKSELIATLNKIDGDPEVAVLNVTHVPDGLEENEAIGHEIIDIDYLEGAVDSDDQVMNVIALFI